MVWGQPGSRGYAASFAILAAAIVLVGCGTLSLLPRANDQLPSGFASIAQLRAAYARIAPGMTPASQLSHIGFDATASNVEVLSYLGLMERYLPRDSRKFDALAPEVQDCILAGDRCTAYVFHAGAPQVSEESMFGFSQGAKRTGAEVMLLVEDGRVAYKSITDQS